MNAERLAAALRSGALTGRAHARESPPAMFGMSLFTPAGQPLSERRSESYEDGLTKVRLAVAARTGNAYRLRKMSASTESIKDLKADESLAKSRANSGAHPPEKEP